MINGFIPTGIQTQEIIDLGCNINPNGQALIISQELKKIPTLEEILESNTGDLFNADMLFLDEGCEGCIETIRQNCQITLLEEYLRSK